MWKLLSLEKSNSTITSHGLRHLQERGDTLETGKGLIQIRDRERSFNITNFQAFMHILICVFAGVGKHCVIFIRIRNGWIFEKHINSHL